MAGVEDLTGKKKHTGLGKAQNRTGGVPGASRALLDLLKNESLPKMAVCPEESGGERGRSVGPSGRNPVWSESVDPPQVPVSTASSPAGEVGEPFRGGT